MVSMYDVSPFENVNDLTRHNEINERYDSNDENESEEESEGANQRRMVSDESKKYPLKPYLKLKKEYYFIDQLVCKRLTSEKSKVHVMVHAQNVSSSWNLDGAHDVTLKDGAMVYAPEFSIMINEDKSDLVFPEERKLFNSMICTRFLLEKCKEVVQYMFMEIKRVVQGILMMCAELDNSKELEVSLFKMTTLSWYLNIIIVVFDPGGDCGYLQYTLPMVFILEDKDILRRRDCNQLVIFGPSGMCDELDQSLV